MAEYKGLKAILKRFCDLIEPVGTVKMSASTIAPTWHLYAVGQLVNIADYPELYEALGGASSPWNTGTIPTGQFRVPDMRECTPVGVGKNTTLIFDNTELDPATGTAGTQDHDVYTLGQFKDDQMQNITGKVGHVNGGNDGSGTGAFKATATADAASAQASNKYYDFVFNSWRVARTGYNSSGVLTGSDTTHGKQVGLNYIIKY